MNGFLIANKPTGITSSNLVVFVRKRLPRGTAVGHGGTLDPGASGVLPICVGAATRLFDYIIDKTKTYVAELQLGVEELRALLPRFTGEIEQVPPMYSAIKKDGQRLYQLARRGEAVAVEPRKCRVEAIELLEDCGGGRYRLRVDCGRGVYIRTLCHDIGAALGCGGHMASLCRTRTGAFAIEDALSREEIDAAAQAGALADKLLPPDFPLGHLPAVRVGEAARHAVVNGNPLKPRWLDAPAPDAPAVRVYLNEVFAGIGAPQPDGSVRFKAMLLPEEERHARLEE